MDRCTFSGLTQDDKCSFPGVMHGTQRIRIGLTSAVIDETGALVVVFADGTKQSLGHVIGTGIERVEQTDGTGEAGTADTYTIYLTDGGSFSFDVWNGGTGTAARRPTFTGRRRRRANGRSRMASGGSRASAWRTAPAAMSTGRSAISTGIRSA